MGYLSVTGRSHTGREWWRQHLSVGLCPIPTSWARPSRPTSWACHLVSPSSFSLPADGFLLKKIIHLAHIYMRLICIVLDTQIDLSFSKLQSQ